VVHHDVKPANCIITLDEQLVLVDFGLANQQILHPGELANCKTRGRGTPGFSAPEQLAGSPTHQSHDIYAFGATLYFALAGVPPGFIKNGNRLSFSGTLVPLDQQRSASYKNAPAVPLEWVNLIHRCLSDLPEKRPKTMESVLQCFPTPQIVAPPRPKGGFLRFLQKLIPWK
jgi:serine/threonine protein kinase